MAYGYNYQPNYGYQPPMGQLEQLRMQQQPVQPPASMIWVQGEAGAKSYMVAAGNTVPLWDSERQVIYLKSTDQSGMPSMRVFDYAERVAKPAPAMPAAAQPVHDYVTREEFNALAARIDALKPAKEEVKNEPAV